VPTEASGWRSTVRRSIALLVPQPGQKTSSHGVPATNAALIVGDHSMRPVARRRFQRSMTSSASRRAAVSAFSLAAPLESSPRVLTPVAASIGAPATCVDRGLGLPAGRLNSMPHAVSGGASQRARRHDTARDANFRQSWQWDVPWSQGRTASKNAIGRHVLRDRFFRSPSTCPFVSD
jgi:hypothetical protein